MDTNTSVITDLLMKRTVSKYNGEEMKIRKELLFFFNSDCSINDDVLKETRIVTMVMRKPLKVSPIDPRSEQIETS